MGESGIERVTNALAEAKKRGAERDSKALYRIAEILNGTVWTVDMLEEIAEIVRSTGRVIDEPDEEIEG